MKKIIPICIISIAFINQSCKKEGCMNPKATNYMEEAKKDDGTCIFGDTLIDLKKSVILNYSNIVYATYKDAYDKAVELQTAVNTFISNVNESNFNACKLAWKAAREPYGLTEAFRFSGGPIDDEDGPEGLLNAWPLDEGYIDYTAGNDSSGIVNNIATYPTIDITLLESLNESGGEENISVGFHAIEFLLWGQDQTDVNLLTPGNRPYTDFLSPGGTANNQSRRAAYLKACTDQLVSYLLQLKNEWAEGTTNYRSAFLALEPNIAIKNILTGVGTLSKAELPGERMFTALDNQDQEDEHSCFSDNTHRDIILNAQGIQNVLTGTYTKIDGTIISGGSISLVKLVSYIDNTLATDVLLISNNIKTYTNAIPVPFDYALTQETSGGNGPIMTAIRELQKQGDKIVEMGTKLGISVNTELP